jgi:hypothetical protein
MSMQEMAAVITRFQATTDALAALGARLGMGEGDTRWPGRGRVPFGFLTGQKA